MLHKTNMKTFLMAVVLGCASLSLSAHEDASDPNFCSDGRINAIATIKVSGEALDGFFKDKKPVNCAVGIKSEPFNTIMDAENERLRQYVGGVLSYRNAYERHDFFNESPARFVYSYASCQCANMLNIDIDPSAVRPLLIAPEILISETHHTDYELIQGVTFSCNVCVR